MREGQKNDFEKSFFCPSRIICIPAKTKKGNRDVQAGLPFYAWRRSYRRSEMFVFCVITAKRHAALR